MVRFMKKSKVKAWILSFALCTASVAGNNVMVSAETEDLTKEIGIIQNPVISADDGKIVWDYVYFGNYWQSKYLPKNTVEAGEDDVVHTDADGTKYIVRQDKSCYKWEPLKWRVLSVSEDGSDLFLISDKNIDVQPYNKDSYKNVSWEKSSLREWLNNDFLKSAFDADEQEAIKDTEITNKVNQYTVVENPEISDGNNTVDKIYLPSVEEMMTIDYGFTNSLDETETRTAQNTDYTNSGGTAKTDYAFSAYFLRTLEKANGLVSSVREGGDIPDKTLFMSSADATDKSIRPVLHLDISKTDKWTFSGRIKQDMTEVGQGTPEQTPSVLPTQEPMVTMAPEQEYPKNPVIDENDNTNNVWDCIYFGRYKNEKITPTVLSTAGQDKTISSGEHGYSYYVSHEQGYFRIDSIKWRVLSINEDGTDAFLISDKVLDVHQYHSDASVECTWEKSDLRQWVENDFYNDAFTPAEQEMINSTNVITGDNPWSSEKGGDNVESRIYLPSIEEMLNTSYGFNASPDETETRKITATDYTKVQSKGESSDADVYWLRSPGLAKGEAASVGVWGDGVIQTERTVMSGDSTRKLGIRPVIHVDLSKNTLWSYAGQVTPKGIVQPVYEEPSATDKPSQAGRPAKPSIKSVKNVKGKKARLTLSKKVSDASGYEVQYSVKKNMTSSKKKIFKGMSVTVSGLKNKQTYYFTVRAYKDSDSGKIYGNQSAKKSVKIKE